MYNITHTLLYAINIIGIFMDKAPITTEITNKACLYLRELVGKKEGENQFKISNNDALALLNGISKTLDMDQSDFITTLSSKYDQENFLQKNELVKSNGIAKAWFDAIMQASATINLQSTPDESDIDTTEIAKQLRNIGASISFKSIVIFLSLYRVEFGTELKNIAIIEAIDQFASRIQNGTVITEALSSLRNTVSAKIKYINVDITGREYSYETHNLAQSMSERLPIRWKLIAHPVEIQ